MSQGVAASAALRGARRYRLTGTGAFDGLFRSGRRLEGAYLQIVFGPARNGPGRVGYVLGRKMLKLAVDRNRVRRILREAARAARPSIEAWDLIVRLKRPAPKAQFPAIAKEARRLLAALQEHREPS